MCIDSGESRHSHVLQQLDASKARSVHPSIHPVAYDIVYVCASVCLFVCSRTFKVEPEVFIHEDPLGQVIDILAPLALKLFVLRPLGLYQLPQLTLAALDHLQLMTCI